MDKRITENFDFNAITMIATEMERRIKYEQQVVDAIKAIAGAKGLEKELASTNAAIEKEIEKNKGYLGDAERRGKDAEMKASIEEETCRGCEVCIEVCKYDAIFKEEED